jgi:hypothetical protein
MRRKILNLTMTLMLAFTAMAGVIPAGAVEPCCAITAIDMRTQIVTARDTRSGRTFQFKVADTKTLRVGQAVQADFKTMKVSLTLDASEPCCAIVDAPVR